MRIDLPVLDTPLNNPGLAHESTYLEINRRSTFDPIGTLFSATQTGAEKNTFIIPYKLEKDEVAFLRYKIIFLNGLESIPSPPMMISTGIKAKEYSLETYSAIPATPKITISNYNFSEVIPHEDLVFESDDLVFFIGKGTHISSSWALLDANDKVLWKSDNDTINLNKITVGKKEIINDGVYKISLRKRVLSGGLEYETLEGIKIINVGNESPADYIDSSLKINFDGLSLYSNGQSILEFKHGIMNFQYLGLKIYDNNGILIKDELKATTSPMYINTTGLIAGNSYRIVAVGFYIDENREVRNTKIREKIIVAEKYALSGEIALPDYGEYSALGFISSNKPDSMISSNINFSDSFVSGDSPVLIRGNLIYLGEWIESGYLLSNKFIDISSLGYDLNYKIQIMQKVNGRCLIIGRTLTNPENVKIVDFTVVYNTSGIYSISVVNSDTSNHTTSSDSTEELYSTRVVYANYDGDNVIFSFLKKTSDLWGSSVPCIHFKELVANTLILRTSYSTNGYISLCSYRDNLLLAVEVNKNTLDNTFNLLINIVNISDASAVTKSNVAMFNTLADVSNDVMVDLRDKLFGLDLHTEGLDISVAMLDIDNAIFWIRDIKTKSFFKSYRYNITDYTIHVIEDTTRLGNNYDSINLSGYNIYKTAKDMSTILRLSK